MDINTKYLIDFLLNKMRMSDVYQPVIIRELLENNGIRKKSELAASLAAYDTSVQDYYEKIIMRWPKITLTKHNIVSYDKTSKSFILKNFPKDEKTKLLAIQTCNEKIRCWIERKLSKNNSQNISRPVRYEILKAARGKCQLCGISSEICPIDVDHIVPQSKADKNGKVKLHDEIIDVNDIKNLQALCFSCNRSKNNKDDTDYRRTKKLVRDKIPDLIKEEGRTPLVEILTHKKLVEALYDKLTEEHAEFLAANTPKGKIEELVDIVEICLALAKQLDTPELEFFNILKSKRDSVGAFEKGYFYKGDS
jgi:predicted house-cleaning noncanonical NTP pyrophosphatase (MazG superfamily)